MIAESQIDGISEDYRMKISYDKKQAIFILKLFDQSGNYLNEFKVSLFALLEQIGDRYGRNS